MTSNPFLKDIKSLSMYLIVWILIAGVYFVLSIYVLESNLKIALIDSIVFSLLYALIGLSIWYNVRFNPFESKNKLKVVTNHFASANIAGVVWLGAGFIIAINLTGLDEQYQKFFQTTITFRFITSLLLYSLITSFYYLIIYYNSYQEKLRKESELKSLVVESELKMLKFQVNPHFIFNSLNSISSLTLSNPSKAQEMTIKLSEFLRYTLTNNERQISFFRDELKNIRLYLDIEKVRFGDKFEYVESVKDECLDVEIPNMILQPLFENAIKHGVYKSIDKVYIKLYCNQQDGYLKITIENNFDPEAISYKGQGIGLENVKRRLNLIYGKGNLLSFEKQSNIFRVNLFIPIEKLK